MQINETQWSDGYGTWTKAKASQDGQCVEHLNANGTHMVRDTANRANGFLTMSDSEWAAFSGAVRAGQANFPA